jgi:hypothetical protein
LKSFRKISHVLEKKKVHIIDESNFTNWAKKLYDKSLDFSKSAWKAIKFESKETKDAFNILRKMIKGEDVSDNEKIFLKSQSIDLVKIIPLIAIQGIPGAIPITALLVNVGKKYNIDILPSSHKNSNNL